MSKNKKPFIESLNNMNSIVRSYSLLVDSEQKRAFIKVYVTRGNNVGQYFSQSVSNCLEDLENIKFLKVLAIIDLDKILNFIASKRQDSKIVEHQLIRLLENIETIDEKTGETLDSKKIIESLGETTKKIATKNKIEGFYENLCRGILKPVPRELGSWDKIGKQKSGNLNWHSIVYSNDIKKNKKIFSKLEILPSSRPYSPLVVVNRTSLDLELVELLESQGVKFDTNSPIYKEIKLGELFNQLGSE